MGLARELFAEHERDGEVRGDGTRWTQLLIDVLELTGEPDFLDEAQELRRKLVTGGA